MVPQEIYIRNASDTEARGPFILEQLTSLAENEQVTRETVFYDTEKEEWVAIGDDPEMEAAVYPERKKLQLGVEREINALNLGDESAPPIDVTDMLAAAEGRSADTKDKADPSEALARAAKIGMHCATVTLFISGAALLAPSVDLIVGGDYMGLLGQPFAILGAIDMLLFLVLMLQAVAVYPFVRFRAALGAGFLGLLFYAQGDSTTALAAVAGSIGIYFSTVFTNLFGVALAALLGIGGMSFFAYAIITT
jgi:hypothetical protein